MGLLTCSRLNQTKAGELKSIVQPKFGFWGECGIQASTIGPWKVFVDT